MTRSDDGNPLLDVDAAAASARVQQISRELTALGSQHPDRRAVSAGPYSGWEARNRALADVAVRMVGYMRGGGQHETELPDAEVVAALTRYLDRLVCIRDAGVDSRS